MPKYLTTTEIARELRRNQTPEEEKLWEALRNRRLGGFKFLRQHPIIYDKNIFPNGFIVADFYCAEKRLILEVDGRIHERQKLKDQCRDLTMLNKGYNILRIKNEELINLGAVLKRISDELEK